jgi:hypothetical protein
MGAGMPQVDAGVSQPAGLGGEAGHHHMRWAGVSGESYLLVQFPA